MALLGASLAVGVVSCGREHYAIHQIQGISVERGDQEMTVHFGAPNENLYCCRDVDVVTAQDGIRLKFVRGQCTEEPTTSVTFRNPTDLPILIRDDEGGSRQVWP